MTDTKTADRISYVSVRARHILSSAVDKPGTKTRAAWNNRITCALQAIGSNATLSLGATRYDDRLKVYLLCAPTQDLVEYKCDALDLPDWLEAFATGYDTARSALGVKA